MAWSGVLVEELIDQRDDLGAGLPELPGVLRAGQRERGGRAAPRLEMCRQAARGFDDGDIFEQQTHHQFPFPSGRVGVMPEPCKVRGERENSLSRLGVHAKPVGLSLAVIGCLGIDDLLQRAIPLGF